MCGQILGYFYLLPSWLLITVTHLIQQVGHVSEREVLNQQAYMLFYVRDRKNIVPKKPVDIAQKENMKANVNANKAALNSNQALKKELIPTGQAETLLSNASCNGEA